MKKRVTIRDVARDADVSYQTVSRFLNGSPLVSEDARARITLAMNALDYTPSAPARSMKSGKTRVLGVLFPEMANPFFSAIAHGVEDIAYEAGYCVMFCSSNNWIREEQYLRILREQRIAGLIYNPRATHEAPLSILTDAGIEVVCIDERLSNHDSVLLDNAEAAALAVEHLVALGHRRIAMITGPLTVSSGRGRLIGYRRTMRRAGLSLDRSLQATGPYHEEAAKASMARMLALQRPPTAVVAASHSLTIGALAAIVAAGLRISEDIAMVGFDEMSWHPALVSPLTTVLQPSYQIGAQACRLLLDRLTEHYVGSPRHLLLHGSLVVRQSSGATGESASRPLLRVALME